jgi:hypothetical protein
MINLQEIEKEIDKLLESETEASLKSWLKEQNSSKQYLGQGEFVFSGFKSQQIEIATTTKINYITSDEDNGYVDNCVYTMAA